MISQVSVATAYQKQIVLPLSTSYDYKQKLGMRAVSILNYNVDCLLGIDRLLNPAALLYEGN